MRRYRSCSFNVHAFIIVFFLIIPAKTFSQLHNRSFNLGKESLFASEDTKPLSNSAVDILVSGDSVWIGGGKGLDLTTDGGRSWKHFGSESPFDREDIAAIHANGPIIWASLAGSEKIEQGTTLPKGLGLAYSTNNGASWTRIDQPQEPVGDSTFTIRYGFNTLKALSITTPINNITYDLAVTSEGVWTTSFAGGLRKSTDGGKTFQLMVLPPDFLDSISISDTLDFEISPVDRSDYWILNGTRKGMRGHLNHRVFSVMATSDSTIWVGTAGGINLTTNAGASWRKFSRLNQLNPISGNFVVALGRNFIKGNEYIWAATINAMDPQEFRAISFTSDHGNTWSTALRGEFTNNFGFKDEIVYAATNSGAYRSDDGGISWSRHSTFIDPKSRNRAIDEACYSVAAQNDTIWVANSDGLMKTIDSRDIFFGNSWKIFRAAQGVSSVSEVYAYPNPFAPDDEVCRVHYKTNSSGSVTIKVFDFAMFPVRTIIRNAPRFLNGEYDEIWDGKNDDGKQVANGLYYVQVTCGDIDPSWTKIIVLQ